MNHKYRRSVFEGATAIIIAVISFTIGYTGHNADFRDRWIRFDRVQLKEKQAHEYELGVYDAGLMVSQMRVFMTADENSLHDYSLSLYPTGDPLIRTGLFDDRQSISILANSIGTLWSLEDIDRDGNYDLMRSKQNSEGLPCYFYLNGKWIEGVPKSRQEALIGHTPARFLNHKWILETESPNP